MLMTLTNCQHWQLQWLIPYHFSQWATLLKIDCARALAASVLPSPPTLFRLKHELIMLILWTTQGRLIIWVLMSQFCLWTTLPTIIKCQENTRNNWICAIRKIPNFDSFIHSSDGAFIGHLLCAKNHARPRGSKWTSYELNLQHSEKDRLITS